MEKMKKTARVLDTFARVTRVIFAVFGILAAVAGVGFLALYFLRDSPAVTDILARGGLSLDLGDVTLWLAKPLTYYSADLPMMAALMALSAVMMLLAFFAAGILHRILAPMTQGRPFADSVSRDLRRLAWLSLVGTVGGRMLKNCVTALEMALTDAGSLFASGSVTEYRVDFGIDLTDLLIPAALFLLSYIFRYGQELQKQSDETL